MSEKKVIKEDAHSIVWRYYVNNGEATICGIGANLTGAISIPAEIGGYPVTSIEIGRAHV